MAVKISPLAGAGWQFFTDNGVPLAGGKLFTYAAGGTTPTATYTTSAGNVANSNPIILDSAGRTPAEVWLTEGTIYKFVLKTSTDTTIATWDNIPGINDFTSLTGSGGSAAVGFINVGTGAVATTGQTASRTTPARSTTRAPTPPVLLQQATSSRSCGPQAGTSTRHPPIGRSIGCTCAPTARCG